MEAPGKSNRRKPKRVQTLGRPENFWKERERDHLHLKKPGVLANILNHSYFMDGPNGKKWSTRSATRKVRTYRVGVATLTTLRVLMAFLFTHVSHKGP